MKKHPIKKTRTTLAAVFDKGASSFLILKKYIYLSINLQFLTKKFKNVCFWSI
jgi:hypothetical protein